MSTAVSQDAVAQASTARRLEGKVAIITGGAAGAGKETARLFVQHGAKVVIVDIRDDVGREVAASIGGEDVVAYFHCDVSVEEDVKNAVDFAVARFGKLDIMFNNAAVIDSSKRRITSVSTAEFEPVTGVILTGTFLGTKHAARVMVPAGRGGVILNSGSPAAALGGMASHAYTAAKHAVVGLTKNAAALGGMASHAYTAAKHAVVGLTKNAAAELGVHGIRVNCISSFMYPTELSINDMGIDATGIEDMISGLAKLKGVVLKAEDTARAAVFLASDDARYVSGHNLLLDGGYTTVNTAFGLYQEQKVY